MTLWLIARATGMAAMVLLSASMVLGLMMSLRVTSPRWPRGLINAMHQNATTWALVTIAAHVAALLADSAAGVGVTQVLVPFTSAASTLGVGLGVLSLYAVALVWLTTRMRSRLGTARWRMLHRAAFAGFALAMFHGVLAGSDIGRPWATAAYVTAAVAVGGLAAWRLWPDPEVARPVAGEATPARSRPDGGLPPLR